MGTFYVYRFINSAGEIIYVGRTIHLKKRMAQHFGNSGHLEQSAYEEISRIDYITTRTALDMKIKELYYIGKYRPKYNKKDAGETELELSDVFDSWVVLSELPSNGLSDILKDAENYQSERFEERLKDQSIEYEAQLSLLNTEMKKLKGENKSLKKSLKEINENPYKEENHMKVFTFKQACALLKSGAPLLVVYRGTTVQDILFSTKDRVIFRRYNESGRSYAEVDVTPNRSHFDPQWGGEKDIFSSVVLEIFAEQCSTYTVTEYSSPSEVYTHAVRCSSYDMLSTQAA